MGTLFRIKLYAAGEAEAQNGFRAAFDRVAQLDAKLSDYNPESELSRLSQTAVDRPVVVSDDVFTVLSTAQSLARDTDGAFDITLGPVIRLWRVARKADRLPDPESLRRAGQLCGYQKLTLDANRHTVRMDRKGMQLDAGGIAKGFAADEALAVL